MMADSLAAFASHAIRGRSGCHCPPSSRVQWAHPRRSRRAVSGAAVQCPVLPSKCLACALARPSARSPAAWPPRHSAAGPPTRSDSEGKGGR